MDEPGPLTHPSLRSHVSRRRIRLLLVILVGVPLCLTLVVVYVIRFAGRQLQEAVAEADRLDPGWRMTELQAKFLGSRSSTRSTSSASRNGTSTSTRRTWSGCSASCQAKCTG